MQCLSLYTAMMSRRSGVVPIGIPFLFNLIVLPSFETFVTRLCRALLVSRTWEAHGSLQRSEKMSWWYGCITTILHTWNDLFTCHAAVIVSLWLDNACLLNGSHVWDLALLDISCAHGMTSFVSTSASLWLAMMMLACLLDDAHVWGMVLLDMLGLECCKHAAYVEGWHVSQKAVPSCLRCAVLNSQCIHTAQADWSYDGLCPVFGSGPFTTPRRSWWLCWASPDFMPEFLAHYGLIVSNTRFAWKNWPALRAVTTSNKVKIRRGQCRTRDWNLESQTEFSYDTEG